MSHSRFEAVSRRAFLRSSLATGALAALLAACGKSDAETFATPTTTSTTGGAGASDATATTPTATVAPVGDPLPAGAALTIDFSFTPQSGSRIRNPYVAVWLEDASGELVDTVALWYQAGRGQRWLHELQRWYDADQTRITAGGTDTVDIISKPTQQPGSYSVVWNGTGSNGAAVGQGSYFVCIEAAREHGPYQLIREAVTIGADAVSAALADQGELTGASITYVV